MEKQKAEQQSHNIGKTTAKVCAKTVRIGQKGQIGKLRTSKSNKARTSGFDLLNIIINLEKLYLLTFQQIKQIFSPSICQ